MRPKLRWVAPPNWPEMPEGFEPPDGWQPDPAWGAPPPGWQFWQREGVIDVNTGLPWRRRLSESRLGWILSIAFVAIIIIAAIGIPWHHHSPRKINPAQLDREIEQRYSQRGAPGTTVRCPAGEHVKGGTVFLCDITGMAPFRRVEVTVLNSRGEFTVQALQ